MATLEERLATLEQLQEEQNALCHILINGVIFSDHEIKRRVAEYIRVVLQNPVESHPISPSMREQLRGIRDALVLEPDPALTAALAKPPVRPA